jgi:glutathione synthase/RimK-type ligase-like ATP-grasp enzyme
MHALIYAIKNDVHAAAVAWSLGQRGSTVDLFFSADFPSRAASTIKISNHAGSATVIHLAHESDLSKQPYDAIWYRRLAGPVASSVAHSADVPFLLQESDAFLTGLRAIVDKANPHAFKVNSLAAREAARSKILQLQMACECGWLVPETIVSNDRNELKKFVLNAQSSCIAKPLTGHVWKTEAGGLSATQTFVLEQAMLDDDSISFCPMIVQHEIQKNEELRVVVMGQSIFAHAIRTDEQRTDWRVGRFIVDEPASPLTITERHKLLELMDRLGVVFGCFDLIRQRDGKLIFIEINEMGQFLFLEQRNSKARLLDAFTSFLISGDPLFEYSESQNPILLSEFEQSNQNREVYALHAEFSRSAVTDEAALVASR